VRHETRCRNTTNTSTRLVHSPDSHPTFLLTFLLIFPAASFFQSVYPRTSLSFSLQRHSYNLTPFPIPLNTMQEPDAYQRVLQQINQAVGGLSTPQRSHQSSVFGSAKSSIDLYSPVQREHCDGTPVLSDPS
jgi:hypothetical protein